MSELTPNNYILIVAELKNKIKQAKTKAVLAVNYELLRVYWEIGKTIIDQQASEGWGTKIIDRLSVDLKSEFPDMQGLSVRNIKYMRSFADAYPDFLIGQRAVAQLQDPEIQLDIIMQQLVAQLPWSHNIVLLDKVKTTEERIFYAQKTVDNNWSKNVLIAQIDSKLYERQGKAITNFTSTLPLPQADLAKETFKNPYLFDFLGFTEEMKERDIENALITNLKKFLLELGKGFAYVGNQYNLKVEGDDFYLDLLFYNTRLHCYVVFELKVGEFMPEYAGKLNFYLNAIDEQIKSTEDKPTIGVLLCKTPNKTVIEYALRGIDKPVGVSEYELKHILPENLKSDLPTVEELEQEIEKEMEQLETPLKEGLDKIKDLLANLKTEQVQQKLDEHSTRAVFEHVLTPLHNKVKELLDKELIQYFAGLEMVIYCGGYGVYSITEASDRLAKNQNRSNDFKIDIRLQGFKPAGVLAFDISNTIAIDLDYYKYTCRFAQNNDTRYIKLYHQLLSEKEITDFAVQFVKTLAEDIAKRLEHLNN